MARCGSGFTISPGSPSRDPTNAQSAAYKATWTQPAIGATDLTGNAASNTMYTEADNDIDF